jgi:hypothetical protein
MIDDLLVPNDEAPARTMGEPEVKCVEGVSGLLEAG